MFTFKTNQIFKDEKCIGGKSAGRSFCKEVESKLAKGRVTIDFDGTDLITQGFSDEFLSPMLKYYGLELFQQVKFKNCSAGVRAMITSPANRFFSDAPKLSTNAERSKMSKDNRSLNEI